MLTGPVPTAREVVDTLLHAIVHSPDALAELYAPQVVIEMPFGPPLTPARRETGREELRAQIKAGAAERTYTSVENVSIHETTDPDVVVAEFEVHGRLLADDRPFALPFLMIITVRDGLIVSSRDYNNPVVSAQVLGRVPELVAALAPSG
jgi:ketosteroid isomerase-like protein